MADLIVRPDDAPLPRRDARPDTPAVYDTTTPREDSLAERLITTQSPQRPQSTPRIRIEVDGRVVEGLEGQTILEVCRDNGIEIPTLCYEPKLPGFGACRMCVVEVEGEEHPPISCSRHAEQGMVVHTQTEEMRRCFDIRVYLDPPESMRRRWKSVERSKASPRSINRC